MHYSMQGNDDWCLTYQDVYKRQLIIPRHVIGDWLSNIDKALAYLQEDMPVLQKSPCGSKEG